MRKPLTAILLLLLSPVAGAKMLKDTVYTRQNDMIILTYDIAVNGDSYSIRTSTSAPPRIIPGESLKKECKGDLSKLKVVLFDRVGDFGKVKWNGLNPSAFTIPAGVAYDKSAEGYTILGESSPLSFTATSADSHEIRIPLYIAVYEKKQTYRLVRAGTRPLTVSLTKPTLTTPGPGHHAIETERIAIQSSEELEGNNEAITKALSSMQMIKQLLTTESEFPFSQTLQMEIYNLRALKDKITDAEVIDRINGVMLACNEKERELKDAEREASLAAQAQAKALSERQKQEEARQQMEAEEKAKIREEKQQKRTIWMIIGGGILALLAFIGNGIMKHFRDISNRRSIMEMQESLTQQAAHEATRRSREIVRNKAHQVANKGKSKLRQSMQKESASKPQNTKNIKSI